ncbi:MULTISPECIES: HP1 family phage holin [Photobacterium]|uniref:Phage holin family protein n=1 Tax=Photobacterium atrarenae TaxID=865757 RepID=A0ABY5GCS6_9GAMM|nr:MULTISPECIES: HP1 family phage holin [Photobacterium]MBV1842202.1 phage holin family protein [Photobacterium ganghwense]UTV26397.1 phage holin family protein [Photobacterium atrarenae]UXH99934.1 phage holin family protein [Photobacterium sp. TY1-4]
MQEKLSSALSYFCASLLAFFGAFSLQDWATVIGILFAAGTFANNWYYRKKSYKLLQQHPQLRELYEDVNS